MLAVLPNRVEVRWLQSTPYDPAESLLAAVQSFPVLVKPGGVLGYPEEDGSPSRRSVIAQDTSGRILIIVCPHGAFTLHQLALTLLESDLELQIALNLDGGTSTGLMATLSDYKIQIPGYAPIPAVITLNPSPD